MVNSIDGVTGFIYHNTLAKPLNLLGFSAQHRS